MFHVNKKVRIFFNYIIGPVIGVWLFYSLYKQLKEQPNLNASIDQIRQAPSGPEAWKLLIVFLLVFVNWGIEAKKWQILVNMIQPMKFFTALKGVLSGVTLSLNMPNRIGEYGGRILYVKEGNRIQAISLSIAGSMSQLILTLLFGCGGLVFLLATHNGHEDIKGLGLSIFWINVMLVICMLITLVMLLLFFRLSIFIKILERTPFFDKYAAYISIIETFSVKLLLRLLSLSFLRYMTFVLQYVLLLQVLNVDVSLMQGIWIIGILFLVMAIVPSFAIADLGIRGKFSIALLTLYSSNTVGIIGTTFGIWFLNLFVPALMGSLLILGTRIFRER
jgi:hypothetical protein